MKCADCEHFETQVWKWMLHHYKIFHSNVKRPDKLFIKKARLPSRRQVND